MNVWRVCCCCCGGGEEEDKGAGNVERDSGESEGISAGGVFVSSEFDIFASILYKLE